MEKPNYYAVLPANVRYDKRLTPNSKLLYAEITSLCNMNGKCFANNEYFAKLFNVSKISISKWISQLVKYGYIYNEIIYKQGTKEILNRYLTIIYYPIKEKFNTPIKEKFKDNNTTKVEYNNNLTDSNIKEQERKIPYTEKSEYGRVDYSDSDIKQPFEKWLVYKAEKRQKYTAIGERTAFEKLKKLSSNDPLIAEQIIDEAISNNWSGFFALQSRNNKQTLNLDELDFS
jgi:hypothetical protein